MLIPPFRTRPKESQAGKRAATDLMRGLPGNEQILRTGSRVQPRLNAQEYIEVTVVNLAFFQSSAKVFKEEVLPHYEFLAAHMGEEAKKTAARFIQKVVMNLIAMAGREFRYDREGAMRDEFIERRIKTLASHIGEYRKRAERNLERGAIREITPKDMQYVAGDFDMNR
jgi:hypothetical protein